MTPPSNDSVSGLNTALLAVRSSLITLLITKVYEFKLNNLTYKRDYYKKIIDKRIEAYDQLHQIACDGQVWLNSDWKSPYHQFFHSYKSFEEYYKRLLGVRQFMTWYSTVINNQLTAIIDSIGEKIDSYDLNTANDGTISLIPIGCQIYEVLDLALINIRVNIEINIRVNIEKEFMTMSDVSGFLNSMNKRSKTIITSI